MVRGIDHRDWIRKLQSENRRVRSLHEVRLLNHELFRETALEKNGPRKRNPAFARDLANVSKAILTGRPLAFLTRLPMPRERSALQVDPEFNLPVWRLEGEEGDVETVEFGMFIDVNQFPPLLAGFDGFKQTRQRILIVRISQTDRNQRRLEKGFRTRINLVHM